MSDLPSPYRRLEAHQLQPGNTLSLMSTLWKVVRARTKGLKRSDMTTVAYLSNYYTDDTTTVHLPAFDKVAVLKE